MKRHVIIGNSGAAISAVQAIRSVNQEDEIVLISKEGCPAYSPVLTTYYLSGRIPYEGMFICDEAFYREHGVETILGVKAVKVDPHTRQVALADARRVEYDDLLVATGSSTDVPDLPGRDLPGVLTLYTAEEARHLWEAAREAEKVAIVGAGLIGIQAVDALWQRGKRVTLIEVMDRLMPKVLDREGARILQAHLEAQGIEIHLRDMVARIEGGEEKCLVLTSGDRVEAEVILLATGVRPNVDLLEGSGVEVAEGVLVDEGCRTSVEGVYAAGDVAQGPDPVTGEHRVVATWLNAVEQGRVAGLNMAGVKATHQRGVRANLVTSAGLPVFTAGWVTEGVGLGPAASACEEFALRRNGHYRRLLFADNALVGAVLVGEVDEAGLLLNYIERGAMPARLKEELQRRSAFALQARVLSTRL
ncbi:MAG: NAD(P)/FAD-dependent oxidoreductase [Anaerolineae bacterium]